MSKLHPASFDFQLTGGQTGRRGLQTQDAPAAQTAGLLN